jgi:hypothetical protein
MRCHLVLACVASLLALAGVLVVGASIGRRDRAIAPDLVLVPRDAWDAAAPLPHLGPPQAVRRIVIHHDAVTYRDGQSAEEEARLLLSGVRRDSARAAADLPYHFLIARDGRVLAGRAEAASGETRTDYDPADALHIALLGNYDQLEPTAAQLAALRALVRRKADEHAVPGDAIHLHADLATTSCPGSQLRRALERVRWR